MVHSNHRAKCFAVQAWNTTERVLGVMDRGAAWAVKGINHLSHRVEPEHRIKIGQGLVKYFETRLQIENVEGGVQRGGAAFKDAGLTF